MSKPTALITTDQVHQLITAWYEYMELSQQAGDISRDTFQTYKRGMNKLLAWATGREVITPRTIQEWKSYLVATGNKPTSINTWLQSVKRFYEWAVQEGLTKTNPAVYIKGIKRKNANKQHLRDMLTDKEVLSVLAAPDRTTPEGRRDHAILCLMAYCALREIDIHQINLDDLDTIDGLPVVRISGKGSQETARQAVIWNAEAQRSLYAWLEDRGRKPGPVFISLSDRSKGSRLSLRGMRSLIKYYDAAGIHSTRKTLHSLRHSAISKIASKDILKAQQVAGHSSLDVTMIYVHQANRLSDPGEQYVEYKANGNQ